MYVYSFIRIEKLFLNSSGVYMSKNLNLACNPPNVNPLVNKRVGSDLRYCSHMWFGSGSAIHISMNKSLSVLDY